MKTILTITALILPLGLHAQNVPLADDRAEIVIENSLEVIKGHISDFRDSSSALSSSGQEFCAGEIDQAEFNESLIAAYQSWAKIDMYQFGPIEQISALLGVNFWPDKKGFVKSHAPQLAALDDEQKQDPEVIRSLSVAVQGLPVLIDLAADGRCPEVIGVSANVAQYGDEIYEGWFKEAGWAETMRNSGADNPVYRSRQEVVNAIYTATNFGIERAKTRLEEPLGSLQQPLPNRAEASGLNISTDLVVEQLYAVREMVEFGFGSEIFQPNRLWVERTIDAAIEQTQAIPKPLTQAVTTSEGRFAAEAAMTKIESVLRYMEEDIGPELGVETGFTPGDGD